MMVAVALKYKEALFIHYVSEATNLPPRPLYPTNNLTYIYSYLTSQLVIAEKSRKRRIGIHYSHLSKPTNHPQFSKTETHSIPPK